MKSFLFFLIYLFLVSPLYAEIRLPNILSSNMVLQQKSSTKLWGWASPNEKVKIVTSWNNKTITTIAAGNSYWEAEVQTPEAGGPYDIVFQGENKIVLENVLIGEVWVCSGQSNMEWSYNHGISSIKQEFQELNKYNIRLLNVPKKIAEAAKDNFEANWTVCDSSTIKMFSAVGYYFGKKVGHDLNVPIGLINSNWGGTPAEVWTPADGIEKNVVLKEAAAKNKPNPNWPVTPGSTFNAMIAPLVNYRIAGVIWYQGESNVKTSSSYTQLMDTMISAWRKAWNKDFPFYYVQIAPFKYDRAHIGALLREAQTKNLLMKNTGMVVISDLVDDTLNIHPINKKDVGLRLASLALTDTYGQEKELGKSPIFKSFKIKGNGVIINFDNAKKGILINGVHATEIFVAGVNRVFYPAVVKIEKNRIVVSSKDVVSPVAVRYQFNNSGIGNLISGTGLPIAPFRTDNWAVNTSKL